MPSETIKSTIASLVTEKMKKLLKESFELALYLEELEYSGYDKIKELFQEFLQNSDNDSEDEFFKELEESYTDNSRDEYPTPFEEDLEDTEDPPILDNNNVKRVMGKSLVKQKSHHQTPMNKPHRPSPSHLPPPVPESERPRYLPKGKPRSNAKVGSGGLTNSGHPKSMYRGLVWVRTEHRWRARLSVRGTTHEIGKFADEQEAAIAYDDAKVRITGDTRYLNFPERYK